MARRHLIVIPGLGDRGWLYSLLKPIWRFFGFDAKIFVFGWETDVSFTIASKRLLDYVNTLQGKVSIIGVSAGGTAALNALAARPDNITKVVTVCSPYEQVPHLTNKLLMQSIAKVQQSLTKLDKTKHKILSVHGTFDPVVPVALSRPKGISVSQIGSRGHGLTILLALTIMSKPVRRFLND